MGSEMCIRDRFWTGAQRLMDTAGRVEKFNQRFGGMARRKKKAN